MKKIFGVNLSEEFTVKVSLIYTIAYERNQNDLEIRFIILHDWK